MNTLNTFSDIALVYTVLIRLFAIYLCIASLEYLYLIRQFSGTGIFSWKIVRTGIAPRFLPLYPAPLFSQAGVAAMLLVRIIGSIILFIAPFSPYTVIVLALIAAI